MIKNLLLLPGSIISVVIILPVLFYKVNQLSKEATKDGDADSFMLDGFLQQIEIVFETLNDFFFYAKRIFSVLFYAYIYWLIFY